MRRERDTSRPWSGIGLRRERWYGYYFAAPALILLALIILFPLGQAFATSLYRIRGLRSTFIGLQNYTTILFEPEFWNGLKVSAIFTLSSVTLHLVIGMGLALLLNRITFARGILRVLFLTPWVVAASIGAIIWMWLLEPQFGVVNYLLKTVGIIDGYKVWLGTPGLALGSVITVEAWRGMPFIMLMVLAGLQGIPKEQYEAAAIDGATAWQQFRYITLPNLRYILVVATTLDLIYAVRQFDIIAVMTAGGPAKATEVLPVLLYNTAFQANRIGKAAAVGVFLLVVIFLISTLYLRIAKPGRAREE